MRNIFYRTCAVLKMAEAPYLDNHFFIMCYCRYHVTVHCLPLAPTPGDNEAPCSPSSSVVFVQIYEAEGL